ncbi:MAG: hypothetical protein ABIN67_19650 [Ferruginibacter sp.]
MEDKKKEINPADLPQSEVFKRKEVYQHPQPADSGKPLDVPENKDESHATNKGKESEKTSKEEGLNEGRSQGDAGPHEGFENPTNE